MIYCGNFRTWNLSVGNVWVPLCADPASFHVFSMCNMKGDAVSADGVANCTVWINDTCFSDGEMYLRPSSGDCNSRANFQLFSECSGRSVLDGGF